MRVFYKHTVVPIDCVSQDRETPVLFEVTTKGEFVLHNYDHEIDLVLEAFEANTSRCYAITRQWDEIIVDSIAKPSVMRRYYAKILPQKVMQDLLRVGSLLKEAAYSAFKETTYRQPSSKWVDRAGMSFKSEFFGPSAVIKPSVSATPKKAFHSKYKHRQYPGVAVCVRLTTTVPAYITMLNKIPEGVVFDHKQDCWCMTAGIVDVVDRNSTIVVAGKQGRGVAVDSRNALVQRGADGTWTVKKWL